MLDVEITEEEKDEYLVINSIRKNEAFGEFKWWYCENVLHIIQDNPYLNKEKVYHLLSNVDITYNIHSTHGDSGLYGKYYLFFNDIIVFEDFPALKVTFHKVLHCIFNGYRQRKLPRFFKEGMIQLLANEYADDGDKCFELTNAYPFEIAAVKMLCKLTSEDTVLKAFTLGDMDYIIDELVQIHGNEKEVTEAIKIMGEALDACLNLEEYDVSKVNKKCINVFQKCIETKYNKTYSQYISYYYNEMLFCNCLFQKYAFVNYNKDINLYGLDYKAYFSSSLKNKIKSSTYEKKKNDAQKSLMFLKK